jgi:hypothetical protein
MSSPNAWLTMGFSETMFSQKMIPPSLISSPTEGGSFKGVVEEAIIVIKNANESINSL